MTPIEGGCACGDVRYRLTSDPMFVHCCHCTWCQRESGAAFALNAMIERDRLELCQGSPSLVPTPSESGGSQKFYRCPSCQVALWSHYAMATGDKIAFVRVGTLDEPGRFRPDVHIFTSTKQPWLELGARVPVFSEFYDREEIWPPDALARYKALLA